MQWVSRGIVLVAVLSTGCVAQGRSCDLDAGAISMSATATDDPAGVEVEVEFAEGNMSGGGTSLRLCEGKETLSINGEVPELVETYTGQFKYRAELDAPPDVYELEMQLGADGQAISVSLDPPPTFAVTEPAPDAELSRAQDLTLRWDPPDDGQTIEIGLVDTDILCLAQWEASTADDGEHLLPAGTIELGDPPPPSGVCPAEYVLTRTREGAYPSQLHEGGVLLALVRRSARFTSTP